MIQYLKSKFQLTDAGAAGIFRATLTSALVAVMNMLPMIVIMLFAQGILEGGLATLPTFLILIAVALVILTIVFFINYNDTYTVVYMEAKQLRIAIAEKLKELPLSYFSKHDTSDLAQSILKDVADIEHALSHAVPKFYGNSAAFIVISVMMLVWNVPLALCIILPTILSSH